MSADSLVEVVNGYVKRATRLVTVLIELHLDLAMQEAAWERRRLLGGVILLSMGVLMMATSGVLLEGLMVWLAHRFGLPWGWAIALVTAINFLVGMVVILAALRTFQQPFMAQTKTRLAKTAMTLTKDKLDFQPPSEMPEVD